MPAPAWMKINLSREEKDRLIKIASNWMQLYKARATLTEKDCLGILVVEFEGRRRLDIINRVKVWYDKLRSTRELAELWESAGGGK